MTGEPNAGRVCEVWDDDGYCSIEDARFIAFSRDLMPKLLKVVIAAKAAHHAADNDLLHIADVALKIAEFETAFKELEA